MDLDMHHGRERSSPGGVGDHRVHSNQLGACWIREFNIIQARFAVYIIHWYVTNLEKVQNHHNVLVGDDSLVVLLNAHRGR
jgi:hypothetical protein